MRAGGEPFIPHVKKLVDCGSPLSVFQYWQVSSISEVIFSMMGKH